MYTGEISVADREIDGLVEAATMLQVRGIAMASPPPQPQVGTNVPRGVGTDVPRGVGTNVSRRVGTDVPRGVGTNVSPG